MPLIPVFNQGGIGRQISEFKANLVYRGSSRTARATQRNPVLRNQKGKKKQRLNDVVSQGILNIKVYAHVYTDVLAHACLIACRG